MVMCFSLPPFSLPAFSLPPSLEAGAAEPLAAFCIMAASLSLAEGGLGATCVRKTAFREEPRRLAPPSPWYGEDGEFVFERECVADDIEPLLSPADMRLLRRCSRAWFWTRCSSCCRPLSAERGGRGVGSRTPQVALTPLARSAPRCR